MGLIEFILLLNVNSGQSSGSDGDWVISDGAWDDEGAWDDDEVWSDEEPLI